MMNDENLADTLALITRDFELEEVPEEETITEEELLRLLSNRVAWMIEHEIEVLFSTLYRMDVEQSLVEGALHPNAPEPPNIGIARLILERQKQRVYTKKHFKQPPLDDDWAF